MIILTLSQSVNCPGAEHVYPLGLTWPPSILSSSNISLGLCHCITLHTVHKMMITYSYQALTVVMSFEPWNWNANIPREPRKVCSRGAWRCRSFLLSGARPRRSRVACWRWVIAKRLVCCCPETAAVSRLFLLLTCNKCGERFHLCLVWPYWTCALLSVQTLQPSNSTVCKHAKGKEDIWSCVMSSQGWLSPSTLCQAGAQGLCKSRQHPASCLLSMTAE